MMSAASEWVHARMHLVCIFSMVQPNKSKGKGLPDSTSDDQVVGGSHAGLPSNRKVYKPKATLETHEAKRPGQNAPDL